MAYQVNPAAVGRKAAKGIKADPAGLASYNAYKATKATTPAATTTTTTVDANNPLGKTLDKKTTKFLSGDDTYRNALSQNAYILGQNQLEHDTNLKNLAADNDTTLKRIGFDINGNPTGTGQYKQDQDNLSADYAARGLFGSGLNADADTTLTNNYKNLVADQNQSYARNKQAVDTALTAANDTANQTARAAELDAINRYVAKNGVTTTTNNTKKKSTKKKGKK